MGHYAQIDSDDRVIQVIVAEQDFIDSGAVGSPTNGAAYYWDEAAQTWQQSS